MRPILLPKLANNTIDLIEQWILDNMPPYAEGAVLGMSGGVDSSVVAVLTKRAFNRLVTCGTCKYQNDGLCHTPGLVVPSRVPSDGHCSGAHGDVPLKLRGFSLPTNFNKVEDQHDAQRVAESYKILLEMIDLGPVVRETESLFFNKVVSGSLVQGLTSYDRGNMIARIRANILWTLAARYKSIVMGTGNKDEDYGVGYYTLLGDGAVYMNPIGFLSKRLVREVGTKLGLPEDLVKRMPTAGLEAGQTDEKDLGYTYEFVELVIEGIDQGFSLNDLVDHSMIEIAAWGVNKFRTRREAIFDILHRHDLAKRKAEYIRPKVPNIKLEYGVEEHV